MSDSPAQPDPIKWAIDNILEQLRERNERIIILERALFLRAKWLHLADKSLTPEQRVQRWIEAAEQSLKPAKATEASKNSSH
jgi:hypothetical protein